MILLILLFQNCISNSENLPETKHLEGGVFGWPNALASQRNLWSNVKFPYISFYQSDINIAALTREIISGRIDFNLSAKIEEMISSIQDGFDSKDNSTDLDGESPSTISYVHSRGPIFHFQTIQNFIKIINDDNFTEEDMQPPQQCDENLYPNAHLLGNVIGSDFLNNIDCKTKDKIIGQIISYVLIIFPIFIIFLASFIFYIVFGFGRCCCCRAKERSNPGPAIIVFFSLTLACMVISFGFSMTASAYLLKVVNYIFSKEILNEGELICNLVAPSLNDCIQKSVNELQPAIQNISNESSTTVDESLPRLNAVLNLTIENISYLTILMKNLSSYGTQNSASCRMSENEFNKCASEVNSNGLSQNCEAFKIENITLIDDFTDFENADEIAEELDNCTSDVNEVMNVSSSIEDVKDTFVDTIDDVSEKVDSIENVTFDDKCDLSDTFDFFDDLPSFVVPMIKFVLFLPPILMFFVILFQVLAFWMKNCCSRCLSLCCIPCCFCAFCQFLIGLVCTFFGIFIILMNIFYEQGDDVLDTIIKQVTNEDKIISFGSLNLSSVSNNVIGTFSLDSLQLKQIHFIQNFVDAKLDSTLLDILSMKEMPFNDMADVIENAFMNASKTTNTDSLIVDPIENVINQTQSSLPGSNYSNIADLEGMKVMLDLYSKSVDKCYATCSSQFSILSENYHNFINGFNEKVAELNTTRNELDPLLDQVPIDVTNYSNDLFSGFLISIGQSVGAALRVIVPTFNDIDMKWLIGIFNIVRVRLCYNFFTAILCFSISAHLFIFSMTLMSLLLWIRRKGMASKGQVENSSDEDSSSLTSSSDEKASSEDTSSYESSVDSLIITYDRRKTPVGNEEHHDD